MAIVQRTDNPAPFYALALVFLCLIPWLILQYNLRIPADASFLFSGAVMMLEGKSMSEYYFDNNPPMSFIIYIPAALLHSIAGITKHDAVQLYTLSLIGISSIFVTALLSRWTTLTFIHHFTILCAYAAMLCIFPYKEFGQKDHLLAIALFPFALAQLTTIHKDNTGKGLPIVVMILCAPFILVKPHYVILPAALILYRIHKTSLVNIIRAPEIWILGIATAGYAMLLQMLTPDFVTEILPHVLKLYIDNSFDTEQLKIGFAFTAFSAFLAFYSVTNTLKDDTSSIAIFASIAAFLTLIPFVLQNKGFSLHLIPCLAFLGVSLCLNFQLYIQTQSHSLHKYALYIPACLCLTVLYSFLMFSPPIPTKQTYHTSSSLTALLKEKVEDGSFLFESGTTNIFHTHALYLDNTIGSRFPNFWFLNNFDKQDQATQKDVWQTFGTLIAQDLANHKPKLIGLIATPDDDQGFLAFFGSHPDFQDEWGNYKYDGKFILDTKEFASSLFKDSSHVTFDIYIRKE